MGVGFSAVPVVLYESVIALCAVLVRDAITTEIITEMSAAGSLLIAALGINFLLDKQIKVANMIPAIFMPWLLIVIQGHLPFL